jgi:hypothetical protein
MKWVSNVLTHHLITDGLFLSRDCQLTASLESACNCDTYSFEGVTPGIRRVTPDEMPVRASGGKVRVWVRCCVQHRAHNLLTCSVSAHLLANRLTIDYQIPPDHAIKWHSLGGAIFCLCDLAETLFQRIEGSFQVGWKSLRQSFLLVLGNTCWKSSRQARGD